MTTALTPTPKQQYFYADGTPLVGGKLYTYAAGTSTPLATYQDSSGLVSNTNPVILDSRGEADIWLSPGVAYKFILKTPDETTIWTVDNIDLGLNIPNVIITGGTINGVTIGNISPGAGTFTDLTATGTVTFSGNTQMQIPAGTTSERTNTPSDGMLRYNKTLDRYEGVVTVAGQPISTLVNTGLDGKTAVLTTSTAHGLATGDYITVTGVTPSQYNGSFNITVVNGTSFEYTMLSNPGGPASILGSFSVFRWSQIGGGATGGGTDQVFVENDQTVTVSYAIPNGRNASTVGPITINAGVVVTVPSGSNWVIL